MKREIACLTETPSQLSRGSAPGAGQEVSDEPNRHSGDAPAANGNFDHPIIKVYQRTKKLKANGVNCASRALVSADSSKAAAEKIESAAAPPSHLQGNSRPKEEPERDSIKSELVEVEVVQEDGAALEMEKSRRPTRSVMQFSAESEDMADVELEGLKDAMVLDSEVDDNGSSLSGQGKEVEMKMLKNIEIRGRPTTVRELLETGLLEGYPVFYNGGNKGIPLRGTIKDIGILCSCYSCKGMKTIAPCTFEIHACKSYRRATQYICLENGKSLLDVVKDCGRASLKDMRKAIQSIIGPMPEKESIMCRNCKSTFLATSAAKADQLCDLCMITIKSVDSIMHTPYEKYSRPKEVKKRVKERKAIGYRRAAGQILGFKSAESMQVQVLPTPPSRDPRGRKKKSYSLSMEKLMSPGEKKIARNPSMQASSPKSLAIPMTSPKSMSHSKITKKDQQMHKLVFEEGGLPDGAELAYYSRGKKLLTGYKSGSGIYCACCKNEVSPSLFEAHAGWASRRKPYGYIYTSNGVSLHELAIKLMKGRNCSATDNDDLCTICADGGKLVLCDGCPRAFHKVCASLTAVPTGKWYCKYCENRYEREKYVEYNANAVAAGRVPGVDLIEQITNRCIRLVKTPEEAEVIACVICRGYDFSKTGFGPRTVILCDQCEKEFHVGCLKKQKIADLKELPRGKWFCCGECKKIYSSLSRLLNSGFEKLPDNCLDVIKKKHMLQGSGEAADFDVRWRLLSGKIASRETRLLLSEAVAIFHDNFDPILDSITGRDFIPSMVYGRNIRGHDFSGMYCAVLTVNSQVMSAAIIRIFGQDIAELPLVATRIGKEGKGYFQLLFSCMEKLLAYLNIRSFVLPAADEAESIWTKKFQFKKISPDQLLTYKKTCWQMINFQGTSMLERMVPKCRIVSREDESEGSSDDYLD